ncbi:hypothetical protein F5Y18DRAFT_424254 [Xylariaceae sp. FL1019]|nr:hypothetical protein F5Y18DRAFT_424254 [Xylariaceae sp. FL1019]
METDTTFHYNMARPSISQRFSAKASIKSDETTALDRTTSCVVGAVQDADEGGLPCSQYFANVDGRLIFPRRATILAGASISLSGLIYLASSNVFNSIATSAVLYLNISYVILQAILVFRGAHLLPPRYWRSRDWLGYFCDVYSSLAILALIVLFRFRRTTPPTLDAVNWSYVVFVGLITILTGLWFTIGRAFEGPGPGLGQMNPDPPIEREDTC